MFDNFDFPHYNLLQQISSPLQKYGKYLKHDHFYSVIFYSIRICIFSKHPRNI